MKARWRDAERCFTSPEATPSAAEAVCRAPRPKSWPGILNSGHRRLAIRGRAQDKPGLGAIPYLLPPLKCGDYSTEIFTSAIHSSTLADASHTAIPDFMRALACITSLSLLFALVGRLRFLVGALWVVTSLSAISPSRPGCPVMKRFWVSLQFPSSYPLSRCYSP